MIKKRIESLKAILKDGQAILITDNNNRFYFTNFKSSAGTVVISKYFSCFLIDFRYFEKAKNTIKELDVVLCESLYKQLNSLFKTNNIKEIFVETDNVTISNFENLKNNLKEFEISSETTVSEHIKKLRSIKSEKETTYISLAQELTDKTFSYILPKIKLGMTEKEIMLDMEFFMRSLGSEGVSFDFIVVSGKNTSLPHGVPTDKKIQNGDFITMDFGAVINGYHSDMTRTVAVGSVTKKQREVYETVLKAQKETLNFIKPNVSCYDVDKTARDIISLAGYGECFGHGLGHSVGLEIHESPACNTRDKTLLQKGMIMTVEPGIYIENEFGVRIEDMVVVTENGCQNLTKSPKELIIL